MVALNENFAFENPHSVEENRVGDFFADRAKSSRVNRLSAQQPRLEKAHAYDEIASGMFFYGYRYYDATIGRWLSRDPIEEWGGLNLYGMVWNDPINYIDPDGRSPISVLIKQMAKTGFKKGLKEYAEKQIKRRLKRYMSKGELKNFASDLADVMDTLDSAWWEVCIEFIPVAGDFYGTGRFAMKVRKAHRKMQDLENKYVDKIANRLSPKERKKFLDNKRRNGVSDAKTDTDAMNRELGTNEQYSGLEGHHRDSVSSTPGRSTDPTNIDFQNRSDHLDTHGGDFGNSTSSAGDVHRN